jgi:elongation factor Ts
MKTKATLKKKRMTTMSEITADMIKDLRERTGVGMAKCKEALVLAEGDREKAVDILRKAGMAAGVKKEGRETKEGMIFSLEDKHSVVLLEANTETDFVANNERFKHFVHDCAKQALETKPLSLEQLLQQRYYKDKTITLEQLRNLTVQMLGENIQLRRLEVIPKHQNCSYGIYSHMGGKLLVIVEVEGASGQEDVAREIAMHVAAENPDYLRSEEVPPQVLTREEEIARSQVQGKPENIIEKIVANKVRAFVDQVTLLHQKYIKDNAVTVAQFLDSYARQRLGKPLKIRCFWRWKLGG